MKLRILVFEDEFIVRQPICTFLRAKGYEVLDFLSPVTCELVKDKKCECPRNRACADLVITDMNMPGMPGLEMVRMMADKGCHAEDLWRIVHECEKNVLPDRELVSIADLWKTAQKQPS